jgi:hypothetical protein
MDLAPAAAISINPEVPDSTLLSVFLATYPTDGYPAAPIPLMLIF